MMSFKENIKYQWKAFVNTISFPSDLNETVKQYIYRLNEELVVLALNLRLNYQFVFGVMITIVLTVVLVNSTPAFEKELLKDLSNVILGLLALFVTAVVFTATLAQQYVSKIQDQNLRIIDELTKATKIFKKFYEKNRTELNVTDKYNLVYALAAETVVSQESYYKFRDWLKKYQNDFEESPYIDFINHPFDIADSVYSNRGFSLNNGISAVEAFQASYQDKSYTNLVDINKLKNIANSSDSTSINAVFGQQLFYGVRFSRLVYYSIFTLINIQVYRVVAQSQYNLIPQINFQSFLIYRFVTIFLVIATLALYVRYLLLFAEHLRRQSVDNRTVNPIFPDPANPHESKSTESRCC